MIQKLRIFSLILIHILILLHIFYWGDNIVGSIDFQEFFHSFLKHGVINSGVLLVIIAFSYYTTREIIFIQHFNVIVGNIIGQLFGNSLLFPNMIAITSAETPAVV